MAYGNGVAPAFEPPKAEPGGGKITLRLHPVAATILASLLTFCGGWALAIVRADATMQTQVQTNIGSIDSLNRTVVRKDELKEFESQLMENQRRIEAEILEIRQELAKGH